jgi:hypothetical protein
MLKLIADLIAMTDPEGTQVAQPAPSEMARPAKIL